MNKNILRDLNKRINHFFNGSMIDPRADIHKSAYFAHGGIGIVIGRNCTIKKGVIIYQNVTLGARSNTTDIFNKVTIYPNSVITANIGENSVIGACSFVNKNVPQNEVWAGNPAEFKKEIK